MPNIMDIILISVFIKIDFLKPIIAQYQFIVCNE